MTAPIPVEQGLALTSGEASLNFSATGHEPVRTFQGPERYLHAEEGLARFSLDDGAWGFSFISLYGRWARKEDGKPGRSRGEIVFTFPLDDEASLPDWLETEAAVWAQAMDYRRYRADQAKRDKALNALRTLPYAPMEGRDPMAKRVLNDLLPDAETREAVWRLLWAADQSGGGKQ
ncbi:hypothetical protein [Streptomyces sp. NPDC059278]|uniref:hypothetical protein n=1 Tax=Streptomyces sp. NPDC059278 TaxID=3346801 RepID=UPI0036BFC4A3